AAGQVDNRKLAHVENVTRNDNVRPSEKDESIAVGVRGRLADHFDSFTVEVHRLAFVVEGFVWNRVKRKSLQMPHHTLDCDDRSAVPSRTSSGAAAEEFLAGLRDRFVAAHMIDVGAGINNVANRLGRESLDGGQQSRRT